MSNVTARKYKELESRIETIEKWLDEKNDDLTRLDMLGNYSFLIKALKDYVDRQEQMGQQMQHMQGQFQSNISSVEEFMKENEIEDKWKEFLDKKQEEAEEEMKKQQAMSEGPEIKAQVKLYQNSEG